MFSVLSFYWMVSFFCLVLFTFYLPSLQSIFLSELFFCDSFSYWLLYVVSVVLFSSMMSIPQPNLKTSFWVFLVGLSSWVVFSTSNLLVLYMVYEFSLFPIIYIIITWGNYPDRGASSMMMLLYTSVFSLPLMVVIIVGMGESLLFIGDSSLSFFPYSSFLMTFVVLLSFSVKLPVYGFHFWLPMAHVEAPTFGSMLLAGVLLKLGGCGLYRFSYIFDLVDFLHLFSIYLLMSTILVTFIAFSQSDFKRLVAYSSVIHMGILVLTVISYSFNSSGALLMIMVFHGFSSPAMFFIVGILYNYNHTRLLSFLRGAIILSPLTGFMLTMIFVSNIPTPPLAPFLAEVILFSGISFMSSLVFIFIFIYVFVSILFNTYWYTSVTFSSSPLSSTGLGNLMFPEFFGLTILLLNTFFLLPMVPLFVS